MSAFGRGNRRRRMIAGAVGAVAVSLTGSHAWAGAAAPELNQAWKIQLPSQEAPVRFPASVALSPLVAVFNATRSPEEETPALGLLAESRFEVPAVATTPSDGGAAAKEEAPAPGFAPAPAPATGFAPAPAAAAGFAAAPAPASGVATDSAAATEAAPAQPPRAEESPPPPAYEPSAADPPLSPMQSALEAATERLVASGDQANPLGGGDWRAARAAIAAFYDARNYETVWVSKDGLTNAGRAVLVQLGRAREDGLSLAGVSLPHAIGSGLAPETLADAETAIASAVVIYAEQATGSRVPSARVWPFAFPAPNLADPGAALAETAAAPDPGKRLVDFNPPQKGYRDLREAWDRLLEAAPADGGRSKRAASERVHIASADASLAFGSLARQRAAILANMEMWRWEPRDMGERRIEVSIPDFSVAVVDGDTVVHQARVIVGKPATPTPVFSATMRYVIINPSWQVPDSIIRKEFMPKLGALSRRGYEVKTVAGRLTVRQLPGDDNALGRIAFMFPNDHAVYLHDTPKRDLFDEEARAFSHGCVRVEDPMSLAEIVLGGEEGKWPEERIEEAVGGPERTVFLPRPLPVHIQYFTEFVNEFGEIRQRPDIYGLTRRVEGILASASQD